MALHDRIRKLTYDDYVRIPDDGQRHEIIDGEHYVTASPVKSHQRLAFKLTLNVGGYVEAHRLGEFYCAPSTPSSRNMTSSSRTSCTSPGAGGGPHQGQRPGSAGPRHRDSLEEHPPSR